MFVDEELRGARGEDCLAGPLGLRLGREEAVVERLRCPDAIREEGYFGDPAHVAISNSRRTSLSDVFRSVEALRSPTISAQGSW